MKGIEGIYYQMVTMLRSLMDLLPYLVWVLVAVLYGEVRSWMKKRGVLKRIDKDALDEVQRDRIRRLERQNIRLYQAWKAAEKENMELKQQIKSAAILYHRGQEVLYEAFGQNGERRRKAQEDTAERAEKGK